MTTEDKLDRLNEMCRSTPDCADCNIYRAGLYYLCVAFTFETMGDKNVNLLYRTCPPVLRRITSTTPRTIRARMNVLR